MRKPVINTHAGDDSDGRLWGIEGINILFILAGLLLSVGLSLMLFRSQAHSAAFSFGLGCFPSSSPALMSSRSGRADRVPAAVRRPHERRAPFLICVIRRNVSLDHCDPNDSVPERLTTEGGRF